MTRIDAQGSDAGCMDLYLREIREDALLTAAEECELAAAIAAGDLDARSRMIRANLRLVVKIARDYTGRGVHIAARVGAAAKGEEILATSAALAERASIRFSLSEPRSLSLKGIRGPIEVRAVDWR